MKALIEGGKSPLEIRDRQGATPLYVAASTDQQQICLYLLSKGADVEARLSLSLTAADFPMPVYLYHAASEGACATQQPSGLALQAHRKVLSWECSQDGPIAAVCTGMYLLLVQHIPLITYIRLCKA